MRTFSVVAVILVAVCAVHQASAWEESEEMAGGYVEPAELPLPGPYPTGGYAGGWGNPQGWRLANSEVLTGGSAKGGKNVLAGGSTSADNGVFTKTKTHSRSRGSSSVSFGMIGGDGGDNNNVQKGGIEYSGGGITNFLSKTQGINNQGVNGANDMWKYLPGGALPYGAGSYAPAQGGYEPESYAPDEVPVL